jgi:energy-converting hydrogenase Eha subunit B
VVTKIKMSEVSETISWMKIVVVFITLGLHSLAVGGGQYINRQGCDRSGEKTGWYFEFVCLK